MTMTMLAYVAILLGPIVLWGVYKLRKMHRETAQAERGALPFETKPRPAPIAFLRRFRLPERTLLEQQLSVVSIFYFIGSWYFVNFFSMALLPPPAWKHVTWTDPSAHVWYQYLNTASVGTRNWAMLCFFLASMVILPLRQNPKAQFYRTRPVGIGLQFWSRVLCALGVLLASTLTGIVISFVLLAAVKGPVWQHLPSAFPGIVTGPNDDQSQMYQVLLATSVPRIFLSFLTTMTLSFSCALAMFAIPTNRSSSGTTAKGPLLLVIVGVIAVFGFSLLDILDVPHWRWPWQLFFYTHLGPPPPYGFAAVPILLSVGLLFLARYLIARVEV